jgi:hypothetical protein
MAEKYTKWKYVNIKWRYNYFPFGGLSKFNQIGIFGMQIYNLATLWHSGQAVTIVDKLPKYKTVFLTEFFSGPV